MSGEIIFEGDEVKEIKIKGLYLFQANMSAGTALIQVSTTGVFKPLEGGSFSTDAQELIRLPVCQMKAGLTGNATFSLAHVGKA